MTGAAVEISCLEVIRELSSYIDQNVDSELRAQITAHLSKCAHCTAVYDGTRNVITLVGDDRSFELPAGFSERLKSRLGRDAK
ncbi:MAG TPA: zf-HC2 domain-containing protein [Terriglobales bacterium]|nr:zf-HC2 domain-containing protein [Terriglobales bacterium]